MDYQKYTKEVQAFQIKEIRYDADAAVLQGRKSDGGATLVPEKDMEPIEVNHDFIQKYIPHEGGYCVIDGDEISFVPASEFESSYMRLEKSERRIDITYCLFCEITLTGNHQDCPNCGRKLRGLLMPQN